MRSNEHAGFFSVLAAVGYRPSDLLSVGVGVRWTALAFDATLATAVGQSRNPRNDLRVEAFGRDLFVPGLVASVQLTPLDALDVALGASWSDGIRGKAKLDIIANAFGTGEVFEYVDGTLGRTSVSGSVPTRRDNQSVTLEVPPIWVPQLSIGIRFADRLRPRIRDSASARRAAGPVVEDAMSSERWDVELDAVYYSTSVRDHTRVTTYDAEVLLRSIGAGGTITETPFSVGECIEPDPDAASGEDSCPKKKRRGVTRLGGRDQVSLRLGGDYNPLPGLLALRAGVSYETDGQDVELYQPLAYMLARFGLHCGLTVRVAQKTDVSIGFAHFIQRDVRLQVNPDSRYPRKYKSAEYNFAPGLGEPDVQGEHAAGGDFDGIARLDIPNGDSVPGPYFVNAGSFTSGLDVVSLTFTQHF